MAVASWQAYLAAWLVKRRVKRPLQRAKGDVARQRAALAVPLLRAPRGVTIEAVTLGGAPGERVDAGGHAATMLYLHGGGYYGCSAETHRRVTVALAQRGFEVWAPDYRLAPEHPFPAALEDAVAAYRGLIAKGVAPSALVVAGDSAGGGLSLAMMLALREAGDPLAAAAALFSPWTDLAATGESLRTNDRRCSMFTAEVVRDTARLYAGSADPRNPLISPLYADLAGLPPMVIHVGKNEALRDDSTRLAEKARAAGVRVELKVWPVVPHEWQCASRTMPEARRSLDEAAAFLRAAVVQTAGVAR